MHLGRLGSLLAWAFGAWATGMLATLGPSEAATFGQALVNGAYIAVLFIIGWWAVTHETTRAWAWRIVSSVQPWHLQVAGLIGVIVFAAIALAALIWERSRAVPLPSLPPKAAAVPFRTTVRLTAEQQHFRLALRTVAMRVVSAHRKLVVVFERAKQVAQPYQQSNNKRELANIADMALGSFNVDLGKIEQMAQYDIEEMNQAGLQELVTTFIRTNYAGTQSLLNTFCLGLRKAGVEINLATLDANNELTTWLAADADCVRLLADIISSPEATSLKSAREKYFGSVGRRWNTGGWT